ncbi:MAG: pyruvate ferredoxin oxidoreductase, partial [Sulfolobales archaeon]
MGKVLPLGGNYAVAYAVKACDVDVITAYPISPQTTIVERLSEFVANGELNAEFLHVESEHSALSVAIGAAAV